MALFNKNHEFFQYNYGDLIYLISPLMRPLAVYKIVDPHNYLLMTLDGKLLQGLFEHERIKPAVIRTSEGYVTNLDHLKQIISVGMLV